MGGCVGAAVDGLVDTVTFCFTVGTLGVDFGEAAVLGLVEMVLLSLVGAPDVLGIEEFVFVSFGLATVTVGTGLGVVVVVEVVVVLLGETAPGLDVVDFGLTTSGLGVVALEVGATDSDLVVVVGVAAPDLGVTPPVSLVGNCEPCVDAGCGVCFCVVVGATLVLEPADPL